MEEKKYAQGLKYEKRRHSYLLGRLSAKHALREIEKRQALESFHIDYGIFQFPVVKHALHENWQVSISHSDNVGLALAFPEAHPMGIDIEKIEDKITDTLESQITTSEKSLLEQLNIANDMGHTLLWTMKEALSKIFKTGLMMDFKSLEVQSLEFNNGYYQGEYTNCAQYKTRSFVSSEHVCTIALPKNTQVDLADYQKQLKQVL